MYLENSLVFLCSFRSFWSGTITFRLTLQTNNFQTILQPDLEVMVENRLGELCGIGGVGQVLLCVGTCTAWETVW